MTTLPRHPVQPVHEVEGNLRFRENAIVRYLLDNGGIGLNDLAEKRFAQDEWEQFAQLIGYSVSGYASLSYVTDETLAVAESMHQGRAEDQARIEYLEGLVAKTRESLRELVPALFRIHPDDLVV